MAQGGIGTEMAQEKSVQKERKKKKVTQKREEKGELK